MDDEAHVPPLPGDATLPLKDKIAAAVYGAAGAGSPIDAFFNAWDKLGLVNDYKRFVHGLEQALKTELDHATIRATISSRVKSNSSITKSIQRRQTAQGRSYTNLDEIFNGIHDLAGLRIVVDFPPGIQATQNLIKNFEVVGESKFVADRDLGQEWKPRFGSFESTNYRVKIHPTQDHALYIYRDVLIEIQVLSLAESLYNKLAHPLVYKKTSGEQLSVKDQKIIDVSHGLSLCYWICLSAMEDQLEAREMPEPVRKIGAIVEDVDFEQNMSELVKATPRLPESDGTISTTVLLDFIRESQTRQTKSFEEIFHKLVQVARHAAPTTIHNFGPGQTSNNFGNINNSSGFGHVNHAPATYNNYYTGNQSSSSAYVKALFNTDPRVDKDEIQDEKGGLLTESSDWILQHDNFKKWDRGDTSRILWINGEPGKGKTMLMCRIVDELSSRTKLSCFFCRANEPSNNNATSVLRGLIYVLIQQDDVAMSCFEKECETYGAHYFENKSFTLSQLRRVFQPVLAAISPRHVYLAIDAVDECVEGQRALLEIITGCSQLQHVKWVVSSRNKPLIGERLLKASSSINLEENKISVSAAVSEYIKHKTASLFDLKRYEESMMQEVMNILSSKAQNTFLWVSLACQMLVNRESFDPVGALGDFPSGLDLLYDMMLKEIRSSSRPKLYQQIMNVVLTVLRPVSLDELQLLAPLFPEGLSHDKKIEVVRYCGCFLSVRESFVHFVHESAKDFLLNPDYGFDYDAGQQHYEILMTSLRIMSTLCRLKDFEPVKYPCTRWAFHISQCKPEMKACELKDGSHIDAFLRESYLEWFKVLGYLRAVPNGISCMNELSLRVSGEVSGFAELIREETSFMRYHKVGVEKLPHTVYGALVFCTTTSIMRKIYGKKEPKWITMKPNINDTPTPIHTIEESKHIRDISLSHDGRLLASATCDSIVRVWDVATGELIHSLTGHTGCVWSVDFCRSNYRLASSCDEFIIIRDAENGEIINSIHRHASFPGMMIRPSVALSKDGNSVVCSSALQGFKLWNSETSSLIRIITPTFKAKRPEFGSSAAISGSGKLLAGTQDDVVLVWNLESGELLHEIKSERFFETPSLKFSTEDTLWLFDKRYFFLLDPATGMILNKGRRGEMALYLTDASQYQGNGPLAVGDSCDTIFNSRLLDWTQNYNQDSKSNLLATCDKNAIQIWDLTVPYSTLPQTIGYPVVSFLPNVNFVISTQSAHQSADIWRFETKTLHQKIDSWPPELRSPLLATNGNIIAYYEKYRLLVKDLSTGVRYSKLEGKINIKRHDKLRFLNMKQDYGFVWILGAISNDGKWMSLGTHEDIHIYNIENARHCQHFESSSGIRYRAVAFSHNSRQLAVGSTDFIKIWDTDSWIERVFVIPEQRQHDYYAAIFLCFSKDDSSLIFYSLRIGDIMDINIWRLFGGHEFKRLRLNRAFNFHSFDSNMSIIRTSIGVFQRTQDHFHCTGYALSWDREWVTWCEQPILWLPPNFRPTNLFESYGVYDGHKIAIGLDDGHILFFEFDPNGPTADLVQPLFLQDPSAKQKRSMCMRLTVDSDD